VSNQNHPGKGSKITVEAIKSKKDIMSIKRLLSARPRDLLLFTLGVNNGLRCGDLLRLKYYQVKDLKIRDTISIREGKTGKTNVLFMNKSSFQALSEYIKQYNPKDYDYLFQSRKGNNNPLTVGSVNGLIKSWCRSINLKGNYGAHTLRKTFGYIQRTEYGVSWEILSKRFSHSSQSITMRYLGITDDEINGILLHDI